MKKNIKNPKKETLSTANFVRLPKEIQSILDNDAKKQVVSKSHLIRTIIEKHYNLL